MKNRKNNTYIGDAKVSDLTDRAGKFHFEGKYAEAEDIYRMLDTFAQTGPEELYLYGDCLFENRKFREAELVFRRCIIIKPSWADAHCFLGNIFYAMGRLDDAEEAFRGALKAEPSSRLACNNIGNVLRDKGELETAIKFYRKALEADPEFADGYYNLANALRESGNNDEALRLYEKCLEFDPANSSAFHLHAALCGKATEKAPDRYVEELFDEYSQNFDTELAETLEYSTPSKLYEALTRSFSSRTFDNAADLGCGTGLSGEALRPLCKKMSGVDLSAGMLEKASLKNIYDSLHKAAINEFLESHDNEFDLLAAADSLIYSGNLRDFFRYSRSALRKGGVSAFSLELSDGADYELGESGRYRHSPEYIEKLAEEFSFDITASEKTKLRKEFGSWVEGVICILLCRI